ncbi:MAG: sigma-54 dependent transcriptional regulator [Nitrospiraceae bacterium]
MKSKILVVDDDPDIAMMLQDRLEANGYQVVVARDGRRALELIEQEAPNVVLLDVELPHLTGTEVLRRLGQSKGPEGRVAPGDLEPPVIVMTAHGTISLAVDAIKLGAYDFLTKPLDKDHLTIVIQKALERESLRRQVAVLRADVDSRYARIVGSSPKLTTIIEGAKRAANSDASILLLGESGTGKELFARSIHQWSPRHAMPMVVINCVALTETLLENELFGHERGAFTGADRLHKGKIEMADGGTVFLDEIGDMPLPLQAKLLRVLQDREFQRVGGTKNVAVNIRVIAATNKDLRQAVKAGQFREDLYFRLNVINFTLPPLRERPDDIPLLADHFLRRHGLEAKRPGMRLGQAAADIMRRYHWPGNIRELDNAIARAVVLSATDEIDPDALGLLVQDPCAGAGAAADGPPPTGSRPYHQAMEEHSRMLIFSALKAAGGNQTKAAEHLHLQRTYLARLIRQKNLDVGNAQDNTTA